MRNLVLAIPALLGLSLAAHADGDPAKGEKVFKKCLACHNIDKPENKVGPHLDGIIGRKVASIADYNYSDAMKAKGAEGAVWDEVSIATYVADPKAFVAKNKMAFPGLKKPEDVADLVAYLKTKQKL